MRRRPYDGCGLFVRGGIGGNAIYFSFTFMFNWATFFGETSAFAAVTKVGAKGLAFF